MEIVGSSKEDAVRKDTLLSPSKCKGLCDDEFYLSVCMGHEVQRSLYEWLC